ncbi:MAG: RNA polymerase sigma factor [uncultured Rubrobacteraceae bacterium]|uniref:RNA polymerase sigma factor n=1 Tax=uncultured Rubrobacteraceae bacterium TaxID=349277 RepID=A0A6J4QWN0_9ACTN|nr:MAG: RNA polymerase sigma factor [uncultured Rubrobacteraceae bacterium]
MSDRTVGRLWARYLKLREELRAGEGSSNEEAWREAERQENQLRARLVVNYSPLVKYVASRVGARVPGAVEQEDMISWGVLGLLDAIETYEPNRPGKRAKFESYAISKIRWSILDQLRSQDWVPRRVRLRAQEIEVARLKLTQELRRSPTETEIAGEVGLGIGQYHNLLDRYSRAQVASLEARLEVDGQPGIEYGALLEDTAAVDPQFQASLEDLRSQLIDSIGRLEDRERLVATFYFYEGLTLKEIGKALELTEGRVSQILRCALTKLRRRLKGSPLAHEAGGWRALR